MNEPVTPVDLDILHKCRVRASVSEYRRETIDSLVARGLLAWNGPSFVASRTASTTRRGLEVLVEEST